MKDKSQPDFGCFFAWRCALLALLVLPVLKSAGPANAGNVDAAFDWAGLYAGVFAGSGVRPRPERRGGEIDGKNPRDLGPAQALLRLAVDRGAGEEGFEADRAKGRLAA